MRVISLQGRTGTETSPKNVVAEKLVAINHDFV
jgi:hypothetical protein